MSKVLDTPPNAPLVKFVGGPRDPDRPHELTRWQRFLQFIWPWAKKSGRFIGQVGSLADAYATAEVAKKDAEAQKYAAEAAEIAAEADLKKQQAVTVANTEIERIFSSETTPNAAKQLQLANLLAANPQITAQLEKIEDLYMRLKMKHGLTAEILREKNPLPTADESPMEDTSKELPGQTRVTWKIKNGNTSMRKANKAVEHYGA